MADLIWPLLAFAFAASVTPGPNVVMLTASGANFGYRATLPHLMGILFGFPVMIIVLGLGLGQVFQQFPQLYEILRAAGSAYLVFLAWKIANAGQMRQGAAGGKPLTFLQAFSFQWVNPKAWMMGIAALTAFTTGSGKFTETLIVAVVFFALVLPVSSIWCLFGTAIGRLLSSSRAIKIFNWSMAGAIVASIALLYL